MAALRASRSLGASPRDLLSALDNALRERMQQAEALRQYGRRALDQLTPSQVGRSNSTPACLIIWIRKLL